VQNIADGDVIAQISRRSTLWSSSSPRRFC